MTSNNENPFQSTAKTSSLFSYLGFTIHTSPLVWTSLSIYPTTKDFVQTFFLEKVCLQNTLPTYCLDICPKFRSFYFWGSPQLKYNCCCFDIGDIKVQTKNDKKTNVLLSEKLNLLIFNG